MGKLSRTEKKIRRTLIEMIEEMPINAIKVKDLVSRAHIGRSTFYIYYDSVYAVLQQIADEFIDGFAPKILLDDRYLYEPCPVLVKNANFLKQNLDMLHAFLGPHGDSAFQARMTAIIRENFKAVTKGSPQSGIHYRMAQEFFVGGQQNMIRFWISHCADMSAEEMAILTYRFFAKIYLYVLNSHPLNEVVPRQQ